MTGDVITGEGDHLNPPLLELWLQLHAFPQLGRAHRGVIRGVGKQDAPTKTTNTKKYTWNACILFIVIVQVHHVDLLSVICRNYYCVTFVFFVHFDHFEKNCYMDRWGGGFLFNKIYIDSYRLRPQSINIKCYQLQTYLECMVELT